MKDYIEDRDPGDEDDHERAVMNAALAIAHAWDPPEQPFSGFLIKREEGDGA